MIYCHQCEFGEKKVPADHLVKGKIWTNYGANGEPYEEYVCADHLEMLLSDGSELNIVETLYQEEGIKYES